MNVRRLDNMLYYALLFLAFSSCLSVAGVNIALGLIVIIAIVRFAKEPIPINIDKGLLWATGLFFLALLLSVVFADDNKWCGMQYVIGTALHMLPVAGAVICIKDSRQLAVIAATMVVSICIAGGFAIWQGVHGDWRASGFTPHPMVLAGYLMQMIPLILVFIWRNNNAAMGAKVLYRMAFCLSMLALMFNGTRGAWISIGMFVVLFVVRYSRENRRRLSYILVALLLFCAGAICLPSVHSRILTLDDMNFVSNSDRVLIWRSAWQMFEDHPITGVGVGNFFCVYRQHYISPKIQEPDLMHAHNNFLQIAAEMGIIGLLAFVYMFGYILVLAYKQSAAQRQNPWPAVLFFATVCLLVQGLTEYNFGHGMVMRLYWLIVGLSCASWRLADRGASSLAND